MKQWLTGSRKFLAVLLTIGLLSISLTPIITSYNNNIGLSDEDITIINVHSYPRVGGEWMVMFTTVGQADLVITAVNGTTWSNDNGSCDLRFLEIRRGDETLDYEWVNNSVIIEDYSSSEVGYETCRVLTSGRHALMFQFGDDVAYAYNDASNWWNTSWYYRKLITVNSSQVATNLVNFPILVNVTDTDLANRAQDDGDDIAFVLYSDNSTQLNHEIELFNGTTGEFVAWVNVTSLSSSIDTKIWMYYNNSGCDSQQNPPDVWDSDFVGVWHLNETGTHNRNDSTINYNNGSTQNYDGDEATTGKIGGADDFDGTNDRISISDSPSLSFTNDKLTMEAWIKVDVLPTTETSIVRKEVQWQIAFHDSNTIRNLVGTSGTTGWTAANDEDYAFSTGTWYYWTFVYDGSVISHKIDGQQVGSTHTVTGDIVDNGNPAYIAYCVNTGSHINGIIDEVRIHKVARSNGWITTSFNTMNDPSNFSSFGNEQRISPIVSNPVPANGSTGILLSPSSFNITISHPVGDSMNITWRTNESGTWTTFNTTDNVGNGTHLATNTSWVDNYLTVYWWTVNVTDGVSWENNTYSFTSQPQNLSPTISDEIPSNGSTDQSLQVKCSIEVNDVENDPLTVYWYNSSDGITYTYQQTNHSISSGDTVYWIYTMANNFSTTYYWKVIVNDTLSETSATYYFTTEDIDTSVDAITPYEIETTPLTVNATSTYDNINVTLWYRYSDDNSSWSVPSNWWNTSWSYRKSHVVQSASGAGTDYQVKIVVENNSGTDSGNVIYVQNKVQNDFDDVRFIRYSDNLTELDYWMGEVNADNATFWVEIPDNISTSNAKLWIYYGNSQAANNSNGSNTFLFFDDFSGDLSKWNRHKTSGAYPQIQNGYLRCGGGSTSSPYGHTVCDSDSTYAGFKDGTIDFKYRGSNNFIMEMGFRGDWNANTGYKVRSDERDNEGQSFLRPPYNSWGFFGCNQDTNNPSQDTWYDGSITVDGNNFNFYRDETLMKSCSDSAYTSAGSISCQNHYGSYSDFDDVRVRKFVSPEPSHGSWTAEEEYSSGAGCDWRIWSNTSNPDENSPWNWTFDFPNGTGYYEFYSIGKKSGSPDETAPSNADAMCYLVPNVAPKINSYNLSNSTGSKLNNATGLLDINKEYYFTINITDTNGWEEIQYINITAWYDNGSDATTYNQTLGGNLNMFLQYENTTGTGVFRMLWPDDEAQLVLGNCTETIINSTTRVINISFKPLSQVRWASSNNTWNTTQNATNDDYSWNFNITVVDASGMNNSITDEYGVYKYTSVLPDSDWVDVVALPGFNDDSSVVTITYSSNYDFNMSIYFEENLTHTTLPSYIILIADNVAILADADDKDDITSDINFTGIREANAIGIFNVSGLFQADNVSQTVQVQFNIYIPLGTMGGKYTAHIATKISHD